VEGNAGDEGAEPPAHKLSQRLRYCGQYIVGRKYIQKPYIGG